MKIKDFKEYTKDMYMVYAEDGFGNDWTIVKTKDIEKYMIEEFGEDWEDNGQSYYEFSKIRMIKDYPLKYNIKPIIRITGSKFRKREIIFKHLKLTENSKFYDVFGGSGIIGVNGKNTHNCETWINDFDKILKPLSREWLKINQSTYDGNMKSFTPAAKEYYERRVKNGYWDKVDIYEKVLKKCNITQVDYRKIINNENFTYYIDPPYFHLKNNNLYKNKIDKKEFYDWLSNLKGKKVVSLNIEEIDWFIENGWDITIEEFSYSVSTSHRKIKEIICVKTN